MRRGFTLIEILVVVAVIGIMATAAVVSINRGRRGAQVRGATRDIFAVIRHARSVALVSQQPSIITYSEVMDGEDTSAKLEVVTDMIADRQNAVEEATTLDGRMVRLQPEEPQTEGGVKTDDNDGFDESIPPEVVRGIRIKVLRDTDQDRDTGDETRKKAKLSTFSNVDFITGRYKEHRAKKKSAEESANDERSGGAAVASGRGLQEEVSIIWETNGRTTPHRVWVYAEGTDPEEGLLIRVDRFGGARVLRGDGTEEDL